MVLPLYPPPPLMPVVYARLLLKGNHILGVYRIDNCTPNTYWAFVQLSMRGFF